MGWRKYLLFLLLACSLSSISCKPGTAERVLIADRMLVGEAVGTYVLPLDVAAVGVSKEEIEECAKDLWPAYWTFWIRPLHSAVVPQTVLAFVKPSHVSDVFEHRYIALGWEQSRDCRDLFVSSEQLINASAAENDNEVIVRHLQAGLLALRIDRELDVSDVAVICNDKDILKAAMLLSEERADTSTYTRLEWNQKYRFNEGTWYPGWWGYGDASLDGHFPETLSVDWPTVRVNGNQSELTFYVLALRTPSDGSLTLSWSYELLRCEVRFEAGKHRDLTWAALRTWGFHEGFDSWLAGPRRGDSSAPDTSGKQTAP